MTLSPITSSGGIPINSTATPENVVAIAAAQTAITQGAVYVPRSDLPGQRLTDFKALAASDDLKLGFTNFLTEVFLQLDPIKFYALLDEVLKENKSYEETYKTLQGRIGEAKQGFFANFKTQFRALNVLVTTLSKQIGELMGKGGKVEGYVEVGYPGRLIRPIQQNAKLILEGRKVVVNYSQSPADYLQTGFPRPNDTYIPYSDANPPKLENYLLERSVEMVVMPIGLHHSPADKVNEFLTSIAKVLKEGGSFILRDHDVSEEKVRIIANLAHSVFNIATGETWENEVKEIRDFKPRGEWIDLLEKFGLIWDGQDPKISDRSENALFRFVKKAADNTQSLLAAETYIKNSNFQQLEQTHLTTLEWHLVHIAKEYADFVKTQPMHKFPYLQHIGVLWSTFFDSVREGLKVSNLSVLTGEYMAMNYFMIVFTTIELLAKFFITLPLYVLPGSNKSAETAAQIKHHEIMNQYADFIVTTPSFQFPELKWIPQVWKTYAESRGNRLVNFYITAITIGELAVKSLVLTPIDKFVYGGRNITEDRLYFVAKASPESLKAFAPTDVKFTPVYSAGENEEQYTVVQTERYLPFIKVMQQMAYFYIPVVSIAGQKKIQLKVKIPTKDSPFMNLPVRFMKDIPILTDKEHIYKRVEVEVSDLSSVLRVLRDKPDTEITYIHEY